MSMTKEAIQHLEKTVLLAGVNASLAEVKAQSPLIALPEGVKLSDLEGHMEHRTSYRFNFQTKSIKDFGEYCKEFDSPFSRTPLPSFTLNAT